MNMKMFFIVFLLSGVVTVVEYLYKSTNKEVPQSYKTKSLFKCQILTGEKIECLNISCDDKKCSCGNAFVKFENIDIKKCSYGEAKNENI